MEDWEMLFKDEISSTPTPNDELKLEVVDDYVCNTCPYPVEILKVDDNINTVTFKCLNPKENGVEKTIQINEYLDSMKKNTYLYNKCSLCNKKQNESKNIFSYCIKCSKIICSDCIDKHLKINEKNNHDLNKEYIIKSNEKNIKCLLHPIEKNLAFCLKCNIHICKECMKSQKHLNHNKINIIEVSVTDDIKKKLNAIINIYKKKIAQLEEDKEKKKTELYNEKEKNKELKEKQRKNKIKEIRKELMKELAENEKLLKAILFNLKIKYENEVKLLLSNFKINNEKINKKYERLKTNYDKKFDKDQLNIEEEYKNNVNDLEKNKNININENLLLFNQILKNTQKNYPNNYYNNNNINNIIYKYYESRDANIKQILSKNIHNELHNNEKEKKKYNLKIKKLETVDFGRNINIKDENTNLIDNNFNRNTISYKNDKNKIPMITMTYKINNNDEKIKVLGENFVKKNKGKCKFLINEKKYNISEYIKSSKFSINKDVTQFIVILTDFKSETFTDLSYMFYNCKSLTSLDFQLFNTQNVTDLNSMFYECHSLSSLDLSSFNTENVTNMQFMFYNCISLKLLNLNSFNTENVNNMEAMFFYCRSLTTIDLSSFNTQNVISMAGMFERCSSLASLDLTSFNTQNVQSMARMFSKCSSLTTINLSSFNTQNVVDMLFMFTCCCSLTTLNLSSFNTENVSNMGGMFLGCTSLLSVNLSSFNTRKADTHYMFDCCRNLLNYDSSDKKIVKAFNNKAK